MPLLYLLFWISCMILTASNITEIATLIIAMFTAIAAIGALYAANQTQKMSQAQLFAGMLKEYASKDMLRDLKLLGIENDKRKEMIKNDQDWEKDWLTNWCDKRFNEPESIEIDEARRHITLQFVTALNLYEQKCINSKQLQKICDAWGFILLFEFVEHLEQKINKKYKRCNFDKLLELCGRKEVESLKKVRPSDNKEVESQKKS